jgi:Helix-turn-helix domain
MDSATGAALQEGNAAVGSSARNRNCDRPVPRWHARSAQAARAPAAGMPPRQHAKRPQIGEVFNPNGMFNGIWVPESLLKCAGISTSAKVLYGRLARFAGVDGCCFPSQETLARELGMTVRQVQRLLAQLCAAGFLRKVAQYRPNGSQTANAYVFLYHAALTPAPVREAPRFTAAAPERPSPHLGGDMNVTGGMTSMSPLEDSQLNADLVKSSSSAKESEGPSAPAAAPNPDRYPRATARLREYFPRTSRSLMGRILRAILAACPEGTDEDIAAAVHLERDQKSPGLWVHTLPKQVRKVIERRVVTAAPIPKCVLCGDAGITWDSLGKASWCATDCAAAEEQRLRNASFVDAWNVHLGEGRATPLDQRSRSPAAAGPAERESR